jgi:hypothetical protein
LNVDLGSDEDRARVGVGLLVAAPGPLVIDVRGGAVSTVKPRVAGAGSAFPARSIARTSKRWLPSDSRL